MGSTHMDFYGIFLKVETLMWGLKTLTFVLWYLVITLNKKNDRGMTYLVTSVIRIMLSVFF